jgi:uncharacterized protein YceK
MIAACVAALALSVLSGCGTVCNLITPGPQPGALADRAYGGVKLDADLIKDGVKAAFDDIPYPCLGMLAACAGLIDLPLSTVADTLLLPLVFVGRYNRDLAAELPSPQEPN